MEPVRAAEPLRAHRTLLGPNILPIACLVEEATGSPANSPRQRDPRVLVRVLAVRSGDTDLLQDARAHRPASTIARLAPALRRRSRAEPDGSTRCLARALAVIDSGTSGDPGGRRERIFPCLADRM